jgi:hypothetical protein
MKDADENAAELRQRAGTRRGRFSIPNPAPFGMAMRPFPCWLERFRMTG